MHIHPFPQNAITTLHRGPFGKVELLRCNGVHAFPLLSEVAPRLHFSLPLVGSFVCQSERREAFTDPTSLLCTQAGESYRICHPHGGDETLVFTPSRWLLSQLSERAEASGFQHRPCTFIAPARVQILARALYVTAMSASDALAGDEQLVELFESIATEARSSRLASDDTLVCRTIEFVHSSSEPALSLKNISAAMGVRATHLTHSFKRRTGQPLYRYVMNLKLARAVHRLATSDEELTQIALDLGFSSHSHFSAGFKARFGMSPSEARVRMGRARTSESTDEGVRRASQLIWRPLCVARGGAQVAA